MKIRNVLYIIASLLLFSGLCKAQDSLKQHSYNLDYSPQQLIVPVSLMLTGALINGNQGGSPKFWLYDWRNEQIPDFRTHVDDYLQFSPIVIAYGLDAFGVKSKNDISSRTMLLAKGELLSFLSARSLKYLVSSKRPDSDATTSFPSGHSTQAFAAATFLSEEYKDRLPWMPYVAYFIASSVGALRIANNRHYLSDVLFGAGLGIISMKIPYWTQKRKKKARH